MGGQAAHPPGAASALITIRLLNRSARSKHVVLLSYPPNETQCGAYVFDLAPGRSSLRQFTVDTKLFLATASQEQQLMQGEPMDDQPPFG